MRTIVLLLLLASARWTIYPQGSVSRGPAETVRSREMEQDARHHVEVARYYLKREKWPAARGRLQAIVKDYPGFSRIDEVYFLLAEVYRRTRERDLALEFYSRLVEQFPGSEFADRARDRLRELEAEEKG
ncbi:MAG: outer membrane protein assembly factor BamD [Acidobacteria bacterium]|nr:outer membrane protein assembly factor BamD [Acidobacteriota bacterium]